MIRIKDMTFSYSARRKPVFSDFNLALEEGNIYGLLGKNGTGKSTLLYLVSGLLRPDRGSVYCDTIAANGIEASARRPEVLQELFLVPEEFEFPLTTLDGYVAHNAPFYPHFSHEVLRRCLHEFELEDTTQLFSLSMGQKKKVLVSFALATGTRFLLMDEPTNGMDIPSKSQFRKVIAQNMTDDRLIVISTHQVHDVEQMLDHIVMLDQRSVLLNASMQDIQNEYTFEYRTPQQMDSTVLYAEPTLQGNAVITRRQEGDAETQVNLELLFNYKTQNK